MLQSSAPSALLTPFAAAAGAGYTRPIPVASQISITPGAASYTDGFPPITFLDPILSGGVPFDGRDLNGVLNSITSALQWEQLNGSMTYNSLVSTAIGGYPNGATLKRISAPGYWQSTVDNNVTNPDTGGAGWQGFNPIDGITAIALTNVNVTLTAAQYGNPIIVLTGTLTGNVSLLLPATIGRWIVSNKCTGAFAITVITAASGSTGYVIPNGSVGHVFSDATNIDITNELGTTRAPGTSDTTLASTAFVAAAIAAIPPSAGAALNGSSSQVFNVANAVTPTEAVALGQFAATLGANGTTTIPGGLIFKWGFVPTVGTGPFSVVFPIAFPSACVHASYIFDANNSTSDANNPVLAHPASGFSGSNWNGVTAGLLWFALGY